VLGNNAFVDPIAGIANGTIQSVEIVDSGVFYEDGEEVILQSDTSDTPGSGVAYVESTGIMEGFWRGDKGTLDSTKRVQDNEYYQEYSYEIQSGVDRMVYESAINNIAHVAGTRMFSKYAKDSYSQNILADATITYESITALTLGSVSGAFVEGELVYQSNGSANTATGTVLSFSSAINTLEVINTTGHFVTSNTVTGANSSASGSTSSINISLS
jgi:hypothetical protein